MNTAQRNLKRTMEIVPKENFDEQAFLQECYEAWELYAENTIGLPSHQLKAIEKKYGFDWKDIITKYNIKF